VADLETSFEKDNWSALRAMLSVEEIRLNLQGKGVLNAALNLPGALAKKRIVQAARVFNRIALKDLCLRYFADTTYTAEDVVAFIEAVSSSRSGSITASIDGSAGVVSFEQRRGCSSDTAAALQRGLEACMGAQQQYKEARSKLLQHPEYIRRRMAQQASSSGPFAGIKGPLVHSGEDMDVYEGGSDHEIN
jgi:hypothetical protein